MSRYVIGGSFYKITMVDVKFKDVHHVYRQDVLFGQQCNSHRDHRVQRLVHFSEQPEAVGWRLEWGQIH